MLWSSFGASGKRIGEIVIDSSRRFEDQHVRESMSWMRSTAAWLAGWTLFACANPIAAEMVRAPEQGKAVGGKSGVEWLDAFAASGGRDLETLWKAFDCDDHSPEFDARLLEVHAAVSDRLGVEAVDAFLDLRRIPHACGGIPERRDSRNLTDADKLTIPRFPYALPLPRLELTDDQLVDELASGDIERRTSAAFTLIVRQRHVDAVVNSLIDRILHATQGTWNGSWGGGTGWVAQDSYVALANLDAYALIFGKQMLGSAFDDVVRKRLAATRDDRELRRFLVKQVGFSGRSDSKLMLDALEPWIEDGGATTRAILCQTLACWGFPSVVSDEDFLGPYFDSMTNYHEWPQLDDAIEVRATRGIARCIDVLDRENRIDVSDLRALVYPLVRSAAAREYILPVVRAIRVASGPVAEEAYRLRGFVGDDDPTVRTAYIERMSRRRDDRRRDPTTDWLIGSEAVLLHHDATTLDCLTLAIEATPFPAVFACALLCIRDPAPELVPRIDALKRSIERSVSRPEDWRSFYESRWPVEPALLPDDSPLVRVQKLAIAIQNRRAEGRDERDVVERFAHALDDVPDPQGNLGFADPSMCCMPYSMWCIVIGQFELSHPAITAFALKHLARVGGFHNHNICRALRHATLDREQARVLARSEPLFVSEHDIAEVLADQEHGLFEVIPRVRLGFLDDLHRDDECGRTLLDLERLDWIYRSGAVSRAAEEWLLLVLEDGNAEHRERALRIIAERKVDSPAVKSAVERRTTDLDQKVRTSARSILGQ